MDLLLVYVRSTCVLLSYITIELVLDSMTSTRCGNPSQCHWEKNQTMYLLIKALTGINSLILVIFICIYDKIWKDVDGKKLHLKELATEKRSLSTVYIFIITILWNKIWFQLLNSSHNIVCRGLAQQIFIKVWMDGTRVVNYSQRKSKEDFEALLQNRQAKEHLAEGFKPLQPDPQSYEVASIHHRSQ